MKIENRKVINRGIGGESTGQLLNRASDVLHLQPKYVVVQTGINDLKAVAVLSNRQHEIKAQVKHNIRHIVSLFQNHGVEVILLTILPASEPDLMRRLVWSPTINKAVFELNRWIKNLHQEGVTIVDLDPIFSHNDKLPKNYAKDTLHLNEMGYEMLNKIMHKLFWKLEQNQKQVRS